MNDDDYLRQQAIERASGSDDLDHLMQQNLRAEQMNYYRRQNNPQEQWDDSHFSRQGMKEIVTGVAILFILGLFFKYVLGVG
ncbi:hypothetical protein [Streptomyces sp. NPDC058252]|uniref:hypothetical protein n=1 Tax=Streptomyces sp. NPDC058252 TaxID=3346405 RepID=UPI0036F0D4C2